MTSLHKNVDEMLARLAENSRGELDFMQRLSEAVRRVDEQLLREVRSVAIQHELRREAILGELQTLASRLCALPARSAPAASWAAIDQQGHAQNPVAINGGGADWRQAAQNINDEPDEFDFAFQTHRH
jgi:hypothetical protein